MRAAPHIAAVEPLLVAGLAGGLILAVGAIAALALCCYRTCSPNQILMVFGWIPGTRSCRWKHGGGAFVWPIIQDAAYLRLDPVGFVTKVSQTPTADKTPVDASIDCRVVIGTEPRLIENAAERLLNLPNDQVGQRASQAVAQVVEESIGARDMADLRESRADLTLEIKQRIGAELSLIGLEVLRADVRVTPAEPTSATSSSSESVSTPAAPR